MRITDWLVALFTGLLVVVGFLQYKLLGEANKTAENAAGWAKAAAKSADESVKAAIKATEVAEENARRQLSAKLWVEGRVTGFNSNGPVKVHLTVKNVGQIPAKGTEIHARIFFDKLPPEKTYGGDRVQLNTPVSLAPGQEITYTQELTADRAAIRGKKAAIFAVGSVEYSDEFQEHDLVSHFASIDLMYGGDYDLDSPMMGVIPQPKSERTVPSPRPD